MRIRQPEPEDSLALVRLAALGISEQCGAPFVRSHIERGEVLVAEESGEVVGLLAYRTDWFQCTFVSLVVVAEEVRRRGTARALFHAVERDSPGPRLFSSSEETNSAAIQMHRALGFTPSGYVDNLPQGYRELLFYKRLPSTRGSTVGGRVSSG